MYIRKILSRNRRDFTAVYECEFCGWTEDGSGYDDANFHNFVVSTMKCKECHKISGKPYKPKTPKYREEQVV